MNENLKINVNPEFGVVTILEGQAPAPQVRKALQITGIINAPLSYLKARKPDFTTAHLSVNREEMTITLTMNDDITLRDVVTGQLQFSEDFKAFQINTGKSWISRELAQFIKMHRSCFETKEEAMRLSNILQNFKASVEKEMEDNDDNRGNIKIRQEQAIKNLNIPESFRVKMPVFKGGKAIDMQVEIYIDAGDLSFTLVSPDAADVIRETRDNEINRVLEEIAEECPQLAIIEV